MSDNNFFSIWSKLSRACLKKGSENLASNRFVTSLDVETQSVNIYINGNVHEKNVILFAKRNNWPIGLMKVHTNIIRKVVQVHMKRTENNSCDLMFKMIPEKKDISNFLAQRCIKAT